jgi:hypothetical protein
MIRSALLLCAGLLAALCFACVAVAPPPPPPPPVALPTFVPLTKEGHPAPATTCNSDLFISNVQLVPNGYDPSGHPGDPPLPQIGTPINPNSAYAQNLRNAFQLAPTSVKTQLCSLTAVYVNGPATCNSLASCASSSWGYRAFKADATYVAISSGLWNLACPDGSPYVYHCFESDLLANLLGWNTSNPPAPQYAAPSDPSPDTFDMTILAVLAHELGHVYWYEVMNPDNPGNDYDPNKFCVTSPKNTFFTNSWKTPVKKPYMWHRFAGRDNKNSHLVPPQITTIDSYIQAADWTDAAIALDQLYQPPQAWASFFGALSPDEDFVETFKLYVLTNAQTPLTSLPINFVSGITEDIPKAYGPPDPNNFGAPSNTGKSALAAKARCIGQSLLSLH